jgi:putative long chain acyl-CoA synthase
MRPLVPDPISKSASWLGAAAQNAFEVARFGGLETDEQPWPFELVAARPVYRRRPLGGRLRRERRVLDVGRES